MKNKINIILVIVIAAFFGLAGGFIAILAVKPYFLENINLPLTQEIGNSQDSLRQANAIVENAKKILLEQENKVNSTISSSQNSLVGVFKKNTTIATSSTQGEFNPADFYKLDGEIGEGLVVTSDGWVLTTDFSKNAVENLILKNYVVITRSKDIYSIDKIMPSGIDSYLFIHLSGAKNLPVKSFIAKADLTDSQSLVALNWRGGSYLTSIVNKKEISQAVRESDETVEKVVLADNLAAYFENAFVFSLNDEIVGFFNNKNGLIAPDNFQPLIKGLLQKKESKRPSLGITYVNLEDFAIKNPGMDKGALIYSNKKTLAVRQGSAGATAGLAFGDIIVSVDNIGIDSYHDLADIIQRYSAGDEINIIYLRASKENAVKVKLGEFK
jgi:hypothetical protein